MVVMVLVLSGTGTGSGRYTYISRAGSDSGVEFEGSMLLMDASSVAQYEYSVFIRLFLLVKDI